MSQSPFCRLRVSLSLAAGLFLAGAGPGWSAERTVVYVPGNFGHPFYNLLGKGVEEQAKKLGWTYKTQGVSTFTAAAQTPIVNSVCGQKPDVLVIAPTDPVGMREPIRRCIEGGVAVVLVDTTLKNTSGVVSAVSSDNIAGGKAAADFIGEALGGKGTVAIQSGQANIITQAQRAEGAIDEFKVKYPGIRLLELAYTNNSESTTKSITRSTLTGTPDVAAFFNTAANCTGPANAIANNHAGKPILVCYDASEAETALLKAGKIQALVVQAAEQEGQIAVRYASAFLDGKKDEVKSSVVLSPIVIPAAKANDPGVQQYYYH